jgi:hypothetical protein
MPKRKDPGEALVAFRDAVIMVIMPRVNKILWKLIDTLRAYNESKAKEGGPDEPNQGK